MNRGSICESPTVPIIGVPSSISRDFSCNQPALDEYFHRYARGNHKKGIGKTFVLMHDSRVVGYYTISMGSVERESMTVEIARGLPAYPIPVARIARLAVSIRDRGKGYGGFLLVDALKKITVASQMIGTYAVVVDAKDEQAKAFYKHFGFTVFTDEPLSLVLPLSSFATELLK